MAGTWPPNASGPARPSGPPLLGLLVVLPNVRALGPIECRPYSSLPFHRAVDRQQRRSVRSVLDLTNWSLYFSERPGYPFANVYEHPRTRHIRWIVVRKEHVEAAGITVRSSATLIGDREPVATIPPRVVSRDQVQIRVYDRKSPIPDRGARAAPRPAATR